jgi:hypothetical protein
MKITKYNAAIFAQAMLLAVMLVKPSIAMTGARNGLILWAYTVLPGIFPASFLASAIMNGIRVDKKYMKLYVILCGILTGFPGAAILYCEYKKMYESDTSLDGMLAYCNISSPSFVCNFIYGFEIMHVISLQKLVTIVYLASFVGIIVCMLYEWAKCRGVFKMRRGLAGTGATRTPRGSTHPTQTRSRLARNVAELMESCCMNMIKAGGFIVFSACLAQYVVYLLPGDFVFRGVITGIIEITTGINQLGTDFGNARFLTGMIGKVPFRFDAASAVLVINALGGISTLLQTISVTGKWLNVKRYLAHKVIYSVITITLYAVFAR